MTPLVNLILFFLGAACCWRSSGPVAVIWRVAARRELARRIVLEDALKHVYNHDAAGRTSTSKASRGRWKFPRRVRCRW
jgi:hypothetical protein